MNLVHKHIALSALALALAGALAAPTSHAADGNTPPVIAIASLPNGHVAPPPTKQVFSVGAGERTKGVFLAQPPRQPNALILGGSRDAIDRATGNFKFDDVEATERARDFCVASDERNRTDEGNDWDPSGQPFSAFFVGESGSRVHAVHLEQFVEDGAGASLEMIDAWVDTSTRGVRKIGSGKLPLKLVATAPGDVRVYAAREEGRVHVVVSEPRTASQNWQGMIAIGDRPAQTSCRHMRMTLPVERGGATATTFLVTAEMPDEHPDPDAEKSNGQLALVALRSRPLHVNASVSWAARDPEPVMSVSMGWEARDRTSQGFRPLRKKGSKK